MKQINILDKIKQLTIKDFFDLPIFLFVLILNIFLKNKIKKKKIWLIEENENEACDNGYALFKYLKKERKDINTVYVINKKAKELNKVKSLGQVIFHRSLRHWLYYLNADKILVTQKYANPSPAIFYILHNKGLIKKNRVFLQHGIIKDNSPWYYYKNTGFRLFICGAKDEYEYIKTNYGYPEKNIVFTGLARYDNLKRIETKNKFILIYPTWRKWIKKDKDGEEYFRKYNELIGDLEFIKCLEKNNVKCFFVLHKNMKKYIENIKSNNPNIIVKNNEDVDIQKMINECKMLVTDYSSIAMDAAYLKKPIIYYQFDKIRFRKEEKVEGYFSYAKDGFGDIIENKKKIIEKIKEYINNNFIVEAKYINRSNKFFGKEDSNNCKRIVEETEKI